MPKEFEDVLSRMCGVKFEKRGVNDNHILIQLLIEDDGVWHEKDYKISSYWIDDLINALTLAKNKMLKDAEPDMYRTHPDGPMEQFGFRFKSE